MAEQLEQRLVDLEEERRRLRDATGRFGSALAATLDADQLMLVVVETAVETTRPAVASSSGPPARWCTSATRSPVPTGSSSR